MADRPQRRIDQGDAALVERILRTQHRWMTAKEIAALLGYNANYIVAVLCFLERDRRAFNDNGVWAGPDVRPLQAATTPVRPAFEPTSIKGRVLDVLVRVRMNPAIYDSRDGWVSAHRIATLLVEPGDDGVTNRSATAVRRALDSLLTNRDGRFVLDRPPPAGTKYVAPMYRATDAAVSMMKQASAAK